LSDLPIKQDINLHLAKLAILVRKLHLVCPQLGKEDELLHAAKHSNSLDSFEMILSKLEAKQRKDFEKPSWEEVRLMQNFMQ